MYKTFIYLIIIFISTISLTTYNVTQGKISGVKSSITILETSPLIKIKVKSFFETYSGTYSHMELTGDPICESNGKIMIPLKIATRNPDYFDNYLQAEREYNLSNLTCLKNPGVNLVRVIDATYDLANFEDFYTETEFTVGTKFDLAIENIRVLNSPIKTYEIFQLIFDIVNKGEMDVLHSAWKQITGLTAETLALRDLYIMNIQENIKCFDNTYLKAGEKCQITYDLKRLWPGPIEISIETQPYEYDINKDNNSRMISVEVIPNIIIKKPGGDELLRVGNQYYIQYEIQTLSETNIQATIALYRNNQLVEVINQSTDNFYYPWTISKVVPDSNYVVRIWLNSYPDYYVESKSFSIVSIDVSVDNHYPIKVLKIKRKLSDKEKLIIQEETKLAQKYDQNLIKQVKGKILLQVEKSGEAWYVDPKTANKFYIKDGQVALDIMRGLAIGITNANLDTISIGIQNNIFSLQDSDKDGIPDKTEQAIGGNPFKKDTDGDGLDDKQEIINGYKLYRSDRYIINQKLVSRLAGQILLQVEQKGEAWYINPIDYKRYYLGTPESAFNIMRFLSTGITNTDLRKIPVGQFSEE